MSVFMHPADVVAAVRKRGTNLAQLARANGLSNSALNYALLHPAKRAEEVLAGFLGLAPQKIWPARYDREGKRLVRMSSASSANISAQRRTRGQ